MPPPPVEDACHAKRSAGRPPGEPQSVMDYRLRARCASLHFRAIPAKRRAECTSGPPGRHRRAQPRSARPRSESSPATGTDRAAPAHRPAIPDASSRCVIDTDSYPLMRNERRGTRVPLVDEVAERIEVVEERVWIDLTPERHQLSFDVLPLQLLAALTIVLPFANEKHGFINMRDERDCGHDRD